MNELPGMIQKLTLIKLEGGSPNRLPEIKPMLQEALSFLHDIKNRCDPEKCIDIFEAFKAQTSVFENFSLVLLITCSELTLLGS